MSPKGHCIPHEATANGGSRTVVGGAVVSSAVGLVWILCGFYCFQDSFPENGLPVGKRCFERNLEGSKEDKPQICEANHNM